MERFDWRPGNILDHRRKPLRTKTGTVIIKINNIGGGWNIAFAQNGNGKAIILAENTDIYTACAILNDLEARP